MRVEGKKEGVSECHCARLWVAVPTPGTENRTLSTLVLELSPLALTAMSAARKDQRSLAPMVHAVRHATMRWGVFRRLGDMYPGKASKAMRGSWRIIWSAFHLPAQKGQCYPVEVFLATYIIS